VRLRNERYGSFTPRPTWHTVRDDTITEFPIDRRCCAFTAEEARRLQPDHLMLALVVEELQPNERSTIPVPAPLDSEVRLRVTRIPSFAATVELVVCDLTRDPRSESYIEPEARSYRELQNDRPPSTSIVRALK